MRKDLLAPSLMCADLLNLERDIRALERARADMLHIDIMDTTFTTSTMLPPALLERLKRATGLPLDVHIMSKTPELYLDQVLPCCKGGFISVHAESTQLLPYVLSEVRKSGARVSLALNASTPLAYAEEVAPMLDMLLLLNVVAGVTGPRVDIDEAFAARIARARGILDRAGRGEALVEVDGNISVRNARVARRNGANVYVLGTASVFRPDMGIEEACAAFRAGINEQEAAG